MTFWLASLVLSILCANLPAEEKQGFDGLEIISGDWKTAPDGTLTNVGGGMAVMGSKNWTNYKFETTFKVSETQKMGPYPGLTVRHDGKKHIDLIIYPIDQQWYIMESGKRLAHGRGLPIKMGEEHRLALTCLDEEICFSMDGKEIGRVEVSSPHEGKAGFLGDIKTTTVFSNPKVTFGVRPDTNLTLVGQIDFNARLDVPAPDDSDRKDANDPGGREPRMTGREVNIPNAGRISAAVTGDGQKHCLGAVLVDNGGERHFLGKRIIRENTSREIFFNLSSFIKGPEVGEVTGKSWGGDGNQKLDFPIRKIELGLNDKPSKNSGVDIGAVKFYLINSDPH